MKNLFANIISSLMIIMILSSMAFAEDKAAIRASCSIPAIPGLNAPLIEEKSVKSQTSAPQPAAQQEEKEEIILAEAKSNTVIVQTFYSR